MIGASIVMINYKKHNIINQFTHIRCIFRVFAIIPINAISKYKNNVKHLLIQSVFKHYGLESSDWFWIRKTISNTEWLLLKPQIIKQERFRTFGLSEHLVWLERECSFLLYGILNIEYRDKNYRVEPDMEG